jgi:ubiquinone/menaquinone biosynthesis C-methylase UbiE
MRCPRRLLAGSLSSSLRLTAKRLARVLDAVFLTVTLDSATPRYHAFRLGRLYDATVSRAFTAWYGYMMRRVDESGLRETRRALLGEAHGRVLDLGPGTGSNLPLFPAAVEQLVLAEPSAHMLRVLRGKVGETGGSRAGKGEVELVQAPAECLPFEDASFDCVTCTMVMCTMPDPQAGLDEVARVLKPGGKFLFLEHVRSEDAAFARTQDRLEAPWRFIADGCHCNRDSLATIEASPLTVERFQRGQMPVAPLFMKPLIFGSASLAT